MNPIRKLRSQFRKGKLDAEMAEEMRLHVELQTKRNIAAGMDPVEARFAALRQFGNVASLQERAREQRGLVWLEHWARDLRLACKSLRRSPGFSLAVFLTLTLCLGPTAAVLSALHALVLNPMPFPQPEQIVAITNVGTKAGGMLTRPGIPQYLDFESNADRFERFALFDMANTTIGEDSVPARALGYRVTASIFQLLGVQPQLGQFFDRSSEEQGRDRVLVLTESFWRTRFSSDPDVIGREIRMGGEVFTIIGVAPSSLSAIFSGTDFLKPYGYAPAELEDQRRYVGGRTALLGRLKAGVTPEEGLAQIKLLEDRFANNQASADLRASIERIGLRTQIGPLRNEYVTLITQPLWVLQAAAVFVLLIGSVNVANLLLARMNSRRPELAIRQALGAGRAALLRTVLSEMFLLAGAASLAGIALAWGGLALINRTIGILGNFIPRVGLEPRVAGFVVLGTLGIALFIGVSSFSVLGRTELRLGSGRTGSSRAGMRLFGSALVVTQVAIALILLVGAGLLMRSYANVVTVDPGFDAGHVVQGRIALSRAYEAPAANAAVTRRIVDAMRSIPGVDGVAASNYFGVGPASSYRSVPFTIRGGPEFAPDARPLAYIHPVSPGFFATLNGRVLLGREFDDADTSREVPVVVIDEAFARRYFEGRNPIGHEMALGAGPFPENFKWLQIVGVVARANITGLENRDGLPFLYLPMGASPGPGFNVLVRSSRAPADVLNAMRTALVGVDPTLPLYNAGSLRETLDALLTPRRLTMLLLAVFAGLALLLAAVGLYGVLAYDVTQRTREIGIRGALGATRAQIIGLILRQGSWRTLWGFALGLAVALLLTRMMRSLLFDVTPLDPVAFVLVPLLLGTIALFACWLPARRAAKVDPMVALRAE